MHLCTKSLFLTLGSQLKIVHVLHLVAAATGSAYRWSGEEGGSQLHVVVIKRTDMQ